MKWTDEDIAKLKEGVRVGKSNKQISIELDRTIFSIRTKLSELGISGRGIIKDQITEIFDILDDTKLGYIVGLFAADGNLEKGTHRVSISLKLQDLSTIEFVANNLSVGHRIAKVKNTYCYKARLPKFRRYLESLGLTPNKSKTLEVAISEKSVEFKKGFFAGIIAGDGCISTALSNKYTYRVSVASGSVKLCEQLLDLADELFGVSGVMYQKGSNYEIIWHTGKALPIIDYLLTLPNIFMQRKYEKAEIYKNYFSDF